MTIYPAPAGEPASEGCQVFVNHREVFCYTSFPLDPDSKLTIVGRPGTRPGYHARPHDRLIEALARYARETRGVPGFLVFPQNAADIIRRDDYGFDNDTERYFTAISGIGQEDLFYNELAPLPAEETDYVLEQLLEFRRRGKAVLVTD